MSIFSNDLAAKKWRDYLNPKEQASMSNNPTRPMTLGEYRVGINFNPSQTNTVQQIKQMAADLIDKIDSIGDREAYGEVARLQSLAMTTIEDGAMWAVKAATKDPR
jgi:hypothetical protein